MPPVCVWNLDEIRPLALGPTNDVGRFFEAHGISRSGGQVGWTSNRLQAARFRVRIQSSSRPHPDLAPASRSSAAFLMIPDTAFTSSSTALIREADGAT